MPVEADRPNVPVNSARVFQNLYRPFRYKTLYGGRGGAKSWEVAQALLCQAHTSNIRIGCFREYQNSIKDSVHQLLRDTLYRIGLADWFRVTDKAITSRVTGSNFLFKGLHHNFNEIKSTEGIDRAWVEEAHLVSKDSWQVLIPTIRKEGSEIWSTFNPLQEEDETYQRLVIRQPPNSWCQKVSYRDNPWFPEVLEQERLYMLETDPEAYQHVWEGDPRVISDAVIFKGKYRVHNFETPTDPPPRFFHGGDFGFSTDPATLHRCYITGSPKIGEELWVDQECYGHQVELDEYEQFYAGGTVGNKNFPGMDTARRWPIKADSSRPETISHIRRRGFQISAAEKWPGSVEDGITHLRGFRCIHIHERCVHLAQEARLYQWKVDRVTGEILPIPVDKHNHCWDGIRYALDGYIKRRGVAGMWARLAK
jgi:phage terminase large subunit